MRGRIGRSKSEEERDGRRENSGAKDTRQSFRQRSKQELKKRGN